MRTSESAVLLVPKDLLQEVTNAQVWQIEVPEGRQPGDSLPCVPNFLELEIFGWMRCHEMQVLSLENLLVMKCLRRSALLERSSETVLLWRTG